MSAAAVVVPLHPNRGADEQVLVAPGDYDAVYIGHRRVVIFRTTKVVVRFRLVDYPQPVVLHRWYRCGFDERTGRISASGSSDLVRELQAVLRRRIRHDRIPIAALADVEPIRIRVRTVTHGQPHGRHKRPLDEVNMYSVVEAVLPPP